MIPRASHWLAAIALGGWLGGAQASGSWVASAPSLLVATADRPMASAALLPPSPELASGQVMGRVGWHYQPPVGIAVNAWLCHPGSCLRLPGPRGQTDGLAGLPADTPLYFQFSLQDRRQRAATLQGLQVIVNHEHLPRP
ncbi:flagellar FlhE [Halomonas sp. MCCC 1A17488]|uniref:flagellar protein FlhE n=1 Tax=unclassified Halomonas TaxID=2609666 RepID=UPI0018D214CB|nr:MULTISPECIES: flagellar protein FlhE [unclassified Halomonas]MCE8014877.1 flagellar FlhE [Halomonas sp. MCCC 1A17488]MCG3238210.1 flagellar FlhE [Halomonas sp. MCCC 1A17488]QPP48026.1 flagellar protein FlhE [Halomonas sp. SS10-MC5]